MLVHPLVIGFWHRGIQKNHRPLARVTPNGTSVSCDRCQAVWQGAHAVAVWRRMRRARGSMNLIINSEAVNRRVASFNFHFVLLLALAWSCTSSSLTKTAERQDCHQASLGHDPDHSFPRGRPHREVSFRRRRSLSLMISFISAAGRISIVPHFNFTPGHWEMS
jgi:hypothetical protein